MTDEDKLKQYIQKHKLPKESRHAPPINHHKDATGPVKKKWPASVYFNHTIKKLIAILGFAFLSSVAVNEMTSNGLYALITAIVIFVIPILSWWIGFKKYLRWMRGKYYVISGWDELISTRSPEFWKGELYTLVTIKIELANQATDASQEAAAIFLTQWEKEWKKRYAKMEWESGSGQPKDFVAKGLQLTGEISKANLSIIIAMLSRKFLPLSRLLKTELRVVRIISTEKEIKYIKKNDGRDAYDRQSYRDSINSLNND